MQMALVPFTAIPLGAILAFLATYGKPAEPPAAHAAASALIDTLPEGFSAPAPIADWLLAAGLQGQGVDIPTHSASSVYLSSEVVLESLASQLGLPMVDKERIVRVFSYLGRLQNDMAIFGLLADEEVEAIAVQLGCKTLGLLCQVSRRFTQLCGDTSL